jgi:hypothetical protein
MEYEMSALNTLKLVASKRTRHLSPAVARRNKLITKIDEQIALCEAQRNGNTYAPKRLKYVVNQQTGERVQIETTKRVKEWFWLSESGKINLAIKYGAKTLSLNKKGANAIELASGDELMSALTTLRLAIANGELDDAITEASTATRKAFNK